MNRLHPLGTLANMGKEYILYVLGKMGDNRTHAAKVLGIGCKTLQRKLKGYGIIRV